MRNAIHKAYFERRSTLSDPFGGEFEQWTEVCREMVALMPVVVAGQPGELQDATQLIATRRTIAEAVYSVTLASVTTECRLKVARPMPVDENDPASDANFRIFHIENIVSVGERNRRVQFSLKEVA